MGWFYNLIIGIGGMIIGLLAFTNEIANKIRLLRNLRSLIVKIPLFLLASFFIIWASIQKDNDNDSLSDLEKSSHANEIKKIDSAYREEKRKSDSSHENILRALVDSSYVKSIKASNEALAKYNLIYIDSLNKVANLLNAKSQNAQLAVAAASIGNVSPIIIDDENGIKCLKIKLVSSGGTSYNIKINYYFTKVTNLGYQIIDYSPTEANEELLTPDRIRTISLDLSPNILSETSPLFIVLMGSFSRDPEGKLVVPFKDSYLFDFKNNKIIVAGHIKFALFEQFLIKNNPSH